MKTFIFLSLVLLSLSSPAFAVPTKAKEPVFDNAIREEARAAFLVRVRNDAAFARGLDKVMPTIKMNRRWKAEYRRLMLLNIEAYWNQVAEVAGYDVGSAGDAIKKVAPKYGELMGIKAQKDLGLTNEQMYEDVE